MDSIYEQYFTVDDASVDRFGRLRPSFYLYIAQEMGGQHSALMHLDYDTLAEQGCFWAVSRHRVQVTRTPRLGDRLRVETWPLPPSRAAFPRSVIAYDAQGNECFRAISLWVLMDIRTRKMIVPGKSGIIVPGSVRGDELPAPSGLVPCSAGTRCSRTVAFTDLDRNGHMNNTRCLDWIADMLPSEFHAVRTVSDLTVCYLAEALEGQELSVNLLLPDDSEVRADASAGQGEERHRVFSAKLSFSPVPEY